MSRIQLPVAVTLPNEENQTLQIIVTPEGVYGRVDTGDRGRGNRFAMYGAEGIGHSHDKNKPVVEMPTTFDGVDDQGIAVTKLYRVVQTGIIEADEDMLRAICERGYATGEEATVVNTIRKALENRKGELHFLQNTEEVGPWVDNVVKPTWTPIIPVAAPVVSAPILIEEDEVDIVTAASVVLDSNDGALATAAMAVHDNWSAYQVPTLDFEWIEGSFIGHKITQFEYFDRARAAKRKRNISITGPTGSGKSTLGVAYCAARGLHHAAIAFGEATDTTALIDDVALVNGHSVRVLTPIGMVFKYGGYVEIQEPNAASEGMKTVLYPWLDAFSRMVTMSNGGQFKIHPDTIIVITKNPVDAAHSHANQMSAALNRRFRPVKMGYVDEIEEKLVPVEALREIAKEIRRSDIKMPFGTDTLVAVHQDIQDLGLAQGVQGLIDGFEEQADQDVVRPIVDVHLDELAAAYGETLESDVEDISLEWDLEAPSV